MARASASFYLCQIAVPTELVSRVPSWGDKGWSRKWGDEDVMRSNEMRREVDEGCLFIKLSIHSNRSFFLENYGQSLKNKHAYNPNSCQVTVHVRGGDPLLFTQD